MSKAPAYYTLITAEILFTLASQDPFQIDPPEEEPAIRTTKINGVLSDPNPEITAALIGKAQQIVQLQFHKRMQGEKPQVLDVVLLSLSPLGYMTEDQFQDTSKAAKVSDLVLPQPKHLSPDDPFSSF